MTASREKHGTESTPRANRMPFAIPEPSYADAFQVLVLQAADEGRGETLFGDSVERVRRELGPFLVGSKFPDAYLEFPLIGKPFLDVTLLYGDMGSDEYVIAEAAPDTQALFEWYSTAREGHPNVSFGFELDTKEAELPTAAIHFQPRQHTELVTPFCEIIGELERAKLYLDLAGRMPESWPLSFFGLFRGRPGFPLRVCGYIDHDEIAACAAADAHIAAIFDAVGFSAYDTNMLEQVSELMGKAPGSVDFQFDVYPDGSLGDTFALDVQFGIEQPELVRANFSNGPTSRIMGLLETWGIADERWHHAADAAFARAIPATRPDGSIGRYAFTLMPQWAKARWRGGVLQPAKLYLYGNASFLDSETENS